MKLSFTVMLSLFWLTSFGQDFPGLWQGNWKGELKWYQGVAAEPKKVTMQLKIKPTDTKGKYTWQLYYGADSADSRPYMLIAVDTSKGHWQIDEQNEIILDQYYIAGRLSGAFTVQSSTIINNYWIEDDELHAEFYTISAQPITITGKGTKDIPSVNSYQVKSYQKAVLYRSK